MQNRTNQEWLTDLQGDRQDQAIEDLRMILIRGLRYALSSRLKTKLDMRIEDFVQDALLRIS